MVLIMSRSKNEEFKKIMFHSIYGPIILFFIITVRLRAIEKFSMKKEFKYLLVMAIFGSIGMLMTGLCMAIFNLEFGINVYSFIFICLFVWPLISFPVIRYTKKAEVIFYSLQNK